MLLAGAAWFNPVAFMFGMVDYAGAHEKERVIERMRTANRESLNRQLFLGADSDHPDGVYARNGSDLVRMTNEEWWHWYGRQGNSGGS